MAVTHGDEQAPSEQDPFAGLVLDETFVKGAKVSEAPARTRDAIARYARLEHPVIGTGRPPQRGPRSKKRRWITVTAVILVAALLGYVVWLTGRPSHAAASQAPLASATTAPNPAPSVAPTPHVSGTPTPQPSELGNWQDIRTIGACITWQVREHAPVSVVSCSRPHVAQITGVVDISKRFGQAWPGSAAIEKVSWDVCAAPFQAFTGLTLADGYAQGYGAASLAPSQEAWDRNVRHLTCTAIKADYGPFTGSVKGLRKPLTT